MARTLVPAAILLGLVACAPAASAEKAKVEISAAMLLNIISQPSTPRVSALDESLRDPGPPPRKAGPSPVTITVRNPCPPGDVHYEPPPLPGRRARY